MKNVVLARKIHLKVSLAWHYFAQSHKTSWKKSIFEKNKIMPQAGFEPTSSWLLEWSLSEFCHKDSCFPRVKNRIYKNVQWSASFNFCHQVTTVLLHCGMLSFNLICNLEAVAACPKNFHGVGIGPLSKILAVKRKKNILTSFYATF